MKGVIPIEIRRTILVQNPGLSEIIPLFCGWEQCKSGYSYGPIARNYYLIHCILEGRGIFNCGKAYHLERGQCFLIHPDEVVSYKADSYDPWRYCWIGFNGEFAEKLFRRARIGSNSPIFGNSDILQLFETLCKKIQSNEPPGASTALSLLSVMFQIFSYLPQTGTEPKTRESYILKAKSYISSMFSMPFSVEQLAQYCRLDRRYLSRIFKQVTGVTLQQYIINFRMQKACDLLKSSSFSVESVSNSVGYRNIYSFSKIFKKEIGLSPRYYRNVHISGKSGQGESYPCKA